MFLIRKSSWIIAAALAVSLTSLAAQESIEPAPVYGPTGTYWTEDAISQVEFYPCEGATCGRIVWMQKPLDKKGRPLVDKRNPDPALRTVPLMGLTILSALRPSGEANTWEGQVYNPRDGNTYPVTVTIESESQIKVRGCGFAGLICRSQQWARVPEDQVISPAQSNPQ
jgi:uncharacterized protein (DUF2147 family)